jgi:peptidyl-prolyl cis-trans isomerase SurA
MRAWRAIAELSCISAMVAAALYVLAPMPAHAQADSAEPVVLDRVVAVVNNQAILSSDVDDAMRVAVLDPVNGARKLTRQRALDELIGRALIEQQMHEEDTQAASPTPAELQTRLSDLRKELPACVHQKCVSDAEWAAFLTAHGLTNERVESYLQTRIEILRFIEQRFRQGVSISPEEIQTYYHDKLLPQYAKGETPPPLDRVSARIEEILLQQRVNVLFDDWMNNLRSQGQVEVVDPSLEPPAGSEKEKDREVEDPNARMGSLTADPASKKTDKPVGGNGGGV